MAEGEKKFEAPKETKHTKISFNKDRESPGGANRKITGIKLNVGLKRKQDDQAIADDQTKRKTSKEDDNKVNKSATNIPVAAGISMSLPAKNEKDKSEVSLKPRKGIVAKAFADDSDSEEEEMPKEARMRMRNIGRDTPTSAGPNSYNKGKEGFINRTRMWEKELKPRTHLEKAPDKG